MTGYFFIADLLGFGSIVRNSTDQELAVRIGTWTTMVDDLAKKLDIDNVQLISDTVFASAESSSQGLKKLIEFSRSLLNLGVPQSLAIRGAITHGDFEWGRLTYGKAIIAAHELEAKQNWIGVACSEGLPHIESHWGFQSLIVYPVPQKSGSIMLRPAVDWNVPASNDLLKMLCSGGLTREGEQLSWALGEKLNNTVQFSVYKHLIEKNRGNPKQFHGLSPMEIIELNVPH